MAKKGQKFKKYDDIIREKIIEELNKGKGTLRSLEKKYKISHNTIMTWMRRYRKNGTIASIVKRGRPKNNETDYKERYEILKKFQAFLKEQQERK